MDSLNDDESPGHGDADAGRGFFLNVNIVLFSQVALYGLAFFLRVILARALGDDGLGTFSLFFLAVLVAGGIGNLGVGLGNIYYLNKGTYSYAALLSSSLFVVSAAVALSLAAVVAYALAFGDELFVSGRAYWLYAAAVPAVVAYLLLTSFLHGSSRFLALSVAGIVQGGCAVGFSLAYYLAGDLSVADAVAAWTGSFLVADVVAFVLVAPGRTGPGGLFRFDLQALRDQVRYGAQGQIANLATLFNYRLDQFLVAAFVTRAAVGHYTVAVGLSEAVWWISSAVAMVLLPRLTEMDRERAAEVTPVICRNALAVSTVAALGMVAVSPLAIRILFGEEFDPAFLPLALLMPGIVAASATRVLGSYLFSQGKIVYNTFATFIALAVTLVLDLALIPWLEVEGAAIASSVAYICALGATLYWFGRVSGRGARETLLLRRDDRELYAGLLARLRGGASGPVSAPGETLPQDQPHEQR
jgi:O-antigen/teichoic acid export membrane protein